MLPSLSPGTPGKSGNSSDFQLVGIGFTGIVVITTALSVSLLTGVIGGDGRQKCVGLGCGVGTSLSANR